MKWLRVLAIVACLLIPVTSRADATTAPALGVAEIVDRNIAARGGMEAWEKIQSMVWIGHIDSARAPTQGLPFVLEMKRPNKARFEIQTQNQTSIRMFDGTNGWKLRPASNGRPSIQPYTDDELRFARDGLGFDGPLLDYQAKGIQLAFEGIEVVEGRATYRLAATLPSGKVQHVWIDMQTFLDIKHDRNSINPSGQTITVPMFYRNYQTIGDLRLPLLIETGTGTGQKSDNMVIDKVLLNPPLEDALFLKPNLPQPRNAVTVNATSLPSPGETR